jgi:hypothetical protein
VKPRAGFFLATALALAACKGREAGPGVSNTETKASAAPPDQLAAGELAEGKDDAFGLPVPRVFTVDARFPDAIFAKGGARPEDVTRYVRDRVVSEHVETSPTRTVFTGATLKRSPGRTLRIEVVTRGESTEIVVRDETRPPAKEGLTEEQRWRELGLTPQGEPIDPTKLE